MKKNTQKTLLLSITALIVCVALLAGTTMAWFTDSVTSGVNTITAGNLDIELDYLKEDGNWATVQDVTNLIDPNALWEPGHTEVVYLRLSNKGSLDLKYRFAMSISRETPGTNVAGNTFNLSDHLQFSVIEGSTVYANRDDARAAAGIGTVLSAHNEAGRAHDEVGTMKAGAADRYFALVVFMPEDVDNVANYKTGSTVPKIELGLNLTATQLASENDSFDNQYDGGAHVNGDLMQSASAAVTAPAEGQNLEIVLNNNAPVSTEKSTTLTVETIPEALAGKEVKFTATTLNAPAAQKNFSIAADNDIEVGALQLNLTVDGENANDLNVARTITTYIDTGLTNVKVTYVPETGTPVEIPDVEYVSATGKLTFTTTHFSNYVVTAKSLTFNEDEYQINNAADLFTFAAMVNVKGNTFAGKTVKLMADIDLDNALWAPIGPNADGANKFQGTFDGNGKTISNLKVDTTSEALYQATGFFGALNGTAKNFTINRATITGMSAPNNEGNTDNGIAVVAGSIYTSGSIESVNVKNATVSGNRYVGGISGYTYGSVKNCTVENVNLTATPDNLTGSYDNGDKVGGVVGTFWHENTHEISGNTATNVTVTGYRDMGGIVGFANGHVTGNIVNGLKLIQNYSILTAPKTTVEAIIGRHDDFEVDASNTSSNVTKQYIVSNNTGLDNAIKSGNEVSIKLLAGTYDKFNERNMCNKTVVFSGTKDTVIDLSAGTLISQTNGATLTFDGVTIQGQTSGFYAGLQHTNKVTFNNCTLNGKLTLYSESIFDSCVFNNKNDYAIWTWGAPTATFTGCTFNSGGKALLLYGGAGSEGNWTTTLNVTDCVFNDDDTLADEKAAIETGNDYNATYNLNVTNTTVNGFAVNPKGVSTDLTVWANKDSMDPAHLNVVIDGVKVY